MVRKSITLLVITLLAISCKAQPAINTCINCYSQHQWDSLLVVKRTSDIMVITLTGANETIRTENNQLLALTDNLSLQNATLTRNNEQQAEMIRELLTPDGTLVFSQDTISLLIEDSVSVGINKTGNQINYQITDGLDRINLFYNKGNWELWVANDKKVLKYFESINK